MKIRNWHKRNTRAALDLEASASVCNGGDKWPHVQISLRCDERGRMDITMTPDEAKKLLAELTHCSARYESNRPGAEAPKDK